jgi:ATP adenylyltransferase
MIETAFEILKTFLITKMRMSHVYQPLMIRTLLEHQGETGTRDIAKAFLIEDESQIEYYEQIVKRYPVQVLSKHHIIQKTKTGYQLSDSLTQLSEQERQTLISLCNDKLLEYVKKRKLAVWEHRFLADGYLSGSVRYDILRRAKGRCACCGISAEERALDIDHIIPRNKGGSDDPTNLQALCYQCNRQKRDRDDTDFSAIQQSYKHRKENCLFCTIDSKRVVSETTLAYAVRDAYPVSELHTLIIPKRHVADWFNLYSPEHQTILNLLEEQKNLVSRLDKKVQGFNVGINSGEVAGQTILHAHVHLIPRRQGDVSNPRGGVRSVFAEKANY